MFNGVKHHQLFNGKDFPLLVEQCGLLLKRQNCLGLSEHPPKLKNESYKGYGEVLGTTYELHSEEHEGDVLNLPYVIS